MKTYVWDACAIVALFNDEKGADVVDHLLVDAAAGKCALTMNKFNLLEVYYGYLREDGDAFAEQQLALIKAISIRISDVFTDELLRQAGKLKAAYKISLADALAVAQAAVDDAVLVTCDHHELDAVDRDGKIQFLWIR